MRNIASFKEEKTALKFWNFLQSEGIESTFEEDEKNEWTIWVLDEEKLNIAISSYEEFKKDPKNNKFNSLNNSTSENPIKKKASIQKSRFKTHNLSESWKRQEKSPGMISLTLIIISVAVFLISAMGKNTDIVKAFLISTKDDGTLSEIFSGEIWRIITPIFLHFGLLHIFFNMYWLYELGSQIEKRKGSTFLTIFVLSTAVISNFAEVMLASPIFGGMSGVVYGLFGYVWIKSRLDPGDGLFIHQTTAIIMIGWFLLCFANIIPGIANWAHAGGLITGLIWGYVSAVRWNRT